MGKSRGIAFPLLVYEILSGYKINPGMWPLIHHSFKRLSDQPAYLIRCLEVCSAA